MAGDTSKSGIFPRVRRALLSGIASFLFRLLVQIVQVPLFLRFWGSDYYGEWLLLYTIPGYFAPLDFGFCGAGANSIAQRVSSGDIVGARGVFTTIVAVVTLSSIFFSGLSLVSWQLLGSTFVLSFSNIERQSLGEIVALLLASSWLSLGVSAIGSLLNGVGRYAEQTALGTAISAFEFLAVCGVVYLGGNALNAALAVLLSRVLTIFVSAMLVRRLASELLNLNFSGLRENFMLLLRPSISYLVFPVTNAISLQGITTIVGIWLGPAVLASVTATRALARLIDIIPDLFVGTITSEAAYAKGRDDDDALLRISAVATLINLLIVVAAGVVLLIFGNVIFSYWTLDKIEFYFGLFFAIVVTRALRAAYVPNASIIVGLNLHTRLGIYSLLSYLFGLALLFILLSAGLGVLGVGLALLIIELGLFFAAYHEISRLRRHVFAEAVLRVFRLSSFKDAGRLASKVLLSRRLATDF